MGSKHAAKYDRIGQAYYDAAAMTRQEFDTAVQRAQKELQGLEERRKAVSYTHLTLPTTPYV